MSIFSDNYMIEERSSWLTFRGLGSSVLADPILMTAWY